MSYLYDDYEIEVFESEGGAQIGKQEKSSKQGHEENKLPKAKCNDEQQTSQEDDDE